MRGRFKHRAVWLALLLGVVLSVPAWGQVPKTVALVTTQPVSTGWGPMTDEQGLILAAGVILEESLSDVPDAVLLPWRNTSGFGGLIESGLYRFQAKNRYDGWRELLRADVYVEVAVVQRALQYEVHSAAGSWTGRVEDALREPKKGVAAMVSEVFRALDVEMDEALAKQLNDPETKNSQFFFAWARWIGFIPSIYNEKPWVKPNRDASSIIHGDPDFMRGMAWALTMLLKPVPVPGKPGRRRTANPHLFDLNVLRVLESRFADRVVGPYNARLRADPHLRSDSLKMLHVEGRTIDILDVPTEEGDPGAPGMPSPGIAKAAKTAPRIRKYVCLALSGVEDKKVVDRLMSTLVDDPEEMVRQAAAASLGGFKMQARIVAALEAAFQDKAAAVRLAALESLAQLGQLKSGAFRAALKDASAEVRWFAISTLIDKAPDAATARKLLLDVLEKQRGAGKMQATMRTFALRRADPLFPEPGKLRPALIAGLASAHAPEQLEALRLVAHYKLAGLSDAVKAQVKAASAEVRARAVEVLVGFDPKNVDEVVGLAAGDDSPEVQKALLAAIFQHGGKRHLTVIRTLLKARDETVRMHACNAVYALCADNRIEMVRAMLSDPSLRVNLSALRLVRGLAQQELMDELPWVVGQHANEYVRCRALDLLDETDDPRCGDLAVASLGSPYFIVRLFAASIVERRGEAQDADAVKVALERARNRWLKLALQDALAHCGGPTAPARVRLNLGERQHTEGGELPDGWQLWLGNLPRDPKEARRMVDQGYRYGIVLPIPPDRAMYGVASWNNSKGIRNTYLLHVLGFLDKVEERVPYLYYLCEFDEPHGLGGGNGQDMLRAFLLEMDRADLLDQVGGKGGPKLDADLRSHWWHYRQVNVAETSNWVVKLLRLTVQRKYPDLRLFPQTLSYMGGGTVDAWHLIDADGDYSWRYDNENLFGHYGRGAIGRAMRFGKPVAMVTWMGWLRPAMFQLDEVYTDTKYPDGPWRLRHYKGTRAALALYASGIEPSYFNHVAYKSMSTRGEDTGGQHTFPRAPWSPTLTDQINKMMAGDKAFYWDKVRTLIEAEVYKKYHPEDEGILNAADDEEEDLLDLEDTEGKMKEEIEERYEEKFQKHFLNAMIGCSWMNIHNTDNSRALANLPKPDTSHRDTLLILSRGTPYSSDGDTFVMPAVALAGGFDMVPNYQCAELVDFDAYDTIMVLDSPYGVSSTLVRKLNEWARRRSGLLYVCGGLNTRKVLLPGMTFDELEEKLLWEEDVQVSVLPRVEETYKDKKGQEQRRQVFPRLGAFTGGPEGQDGFTRVRCTYAGKIEPLVARDGKAVLALWKAPAEVKATVLLDGAAGAGPIYTEALEKLVLELDKKRASAVKRNRYWGHVVWENEQFVIDVATSGYTVLQAARPWQHRGIDIINGDINPLVKHSSSALILKNYVGPYAGGMGDWAVMARTELKEMKLLDADTLRVDARGVTRVSHVGDQAIALKDAADFEEVEGQIDVWKAMWEGKKTFSVNALPGGRELHFFSPEPVTIVVTGGGD